jgi:hypothetical protein
MASTGSIGAHGLICGSILAIEEEKGIIIEEK